MRIKFSLFRFRYSVVLGRDYCGATMTNRQPLPGEDWLRGSDLYDTKRWWTAGMIIVDILSCEVFGMPWHYAKAGWRRA